MKYSRGSWVRGIRLAVSHVKNPLSVIAIFAGLAELGGTAVLPLIHESVQATYVWFLMLFPTLIVGLFFGTLWSAHWKLYAPSDFSDENNWVAAAGDAIRRKYREEANEAAANDSEGAPQEPTPPPEDAAEAEPQNVGSSEAETAHPPSGTTKDDDMVPVAGQFREPRTITHSSANYVAAEELAFLRVSEEFGSFNRHVSPASNRKIVFDGTQWQNGRTTILEVKYFQSPSRPLGVYKKAVSKISDYFETIPSVDRSNFRAILVIVIDQQVSSAYQAHLQQRLQSVCAFEIVLRFYNFEELQLGLAK